MSLCSTKQDLEFRTACTEGNLATVNHFIRMGVNVNCSRLAGNVTPLHLASQHGHSEIVRELLKRGANVDAKTRFGNTALHLAILGGHMTVASVLIEGNANLNICNQVGTTPLHLCCKAGHMDVAKLLLQNGADSTIQNQNGRTAQMVAKVNGHLRITDLFQNKEEKETGGATSLVPEDNSAPDPSVPPLPLESSSLGPEERDCECRICLEVPSKMVFVPCGHLCTCEDCAKQVGQCPICRADIESRVKLYRT